MRKFILGAMTILVCTSLASAAVVSMSSATVAQGTPSVTLTIDVTGGELANGGDLYMYDDGGGIFAGSSASAPGLGFNAAPIQYTIFDSSNIGYSVVRSAGESTLNGTLFSMTFATASWAPGTYTVRIDDASSAFGSSVTGSYIPITANNGSITIEMSGPPAPTAANLLSPLNGAHLNSGGLAAVKPTLTWAPGGNGESQMLHFSGDGKSGNYPLAPGVSSFQPWAADPQFAMNMGGLQGDTLYSWSVDTINATATAPSSMFTFMTPEPAAMVLLAIGGLFLRRRSA